MKLQHLNLDDFRSLQVFLDDFGVCGQPHPKLEGNECILIDEHEPEIHQDLAGNEWMGKSPE